MLHKHISAYLIEVPLSEIDDITGEPSPNLVKIVSEKMNKDIRGDMADDWS